MTAISDARARRYLLGDATDEERSAIEQEYLENDAALDRIEAAEEDLIEDYLAGQLSPPDRIRFERHYLAAPQHRVRVETIRRLIARSAVVTGPPAAAAPPGAWTRVRHHGPWLALAASALIVASIALWRFDGAEPSGPELAQTPDVYLPSPSPAPAPRTFALTLSTLGVRSGGGDGPVVIPPDTDVVIVRIAAEPDARALEARRATIQTVEGREVWRGTVANDPNPPEGTVARLDIPSSALPPGDYFVTLYGSDRGGAEREWVRSFLRVRAR